MKIRTKDCVYVGMIAAICVVATTILIPLPTGGMVHLGSAAVFTLSILFGGLYGGLGAAIGSGIFDVLMGHMQYTLFSIVIKGIAGILVGTIATSFYAPTLHTPYPKFSKLIIALIVGSIWTAFGYFIAWWYVLGSAYIAFAHLPASFLTSGVGIIITLLLVPSLQKKIRSMICSSRDKSH